MLYDVTEWHDLFVATAGATAALAGLVFVAVSINIERILQFTGLPDRAFETVQLLLCALVVSILGLVPQDIRYFALEMLVTALALLGWMARSLRHTVRGRADGESLYLTTRIALAIPGSVPYVIAGISLLASAGGGLAWVVVGLIGALIGAVINAWVLLVEILR